MKENLESDGCKWRQIFMQWVQMKANLYVMDANESKSWNQLKANLESKSWKKILKSGKIPYERPVATGSGGLYVRMDWSLYLIVRTLSESDENLDSLS